MQTYEEKLLSFKTRELLIAFAKYMEEDKMYERYDEANVDDFIKKRSQNISVSTKKH